MKYKYYIRFRSTEKNLLKQVELLCKNKKISGPYPLPKKRKLFSINRSHHVYKKSQEQFEIIEYSVFWVFITDLPLSSKDFEQFSKIFGFEGLLFDWKLKFS